MIFTVEEILSCAYPKQIPPPDMFDRMNQFEGLAELSPELMPSNEHKPPLMLYGYPINSKVMLRYAEEHGLTAMNTKTNKVHGLQTWINARTRILEDYGVEMYCEGVWGSDGTLWVLRTNYEMQLDPMYACSDEKARVIWKELVGRDEAPKWYLSGAYILPL